jgi:hypothetical protein
MTVFRFDSVEDNVVAFVDELAEKYPAPFAKIDHERIDREHRDYIHECQYWNDYIECNDSSKFCYVIETFLDPKEEMFYIIKFGL